MTPEQIQAVANEIDNNSYSVTVKDEWIGMELTFTAKVNMPYQYWMEMSTFWWGHKEALREADNDVIKRVLLLYGNRVVEYLLEHSFASLDGINKRIRELEGYCHADEFQITNFNYDFDYDLKINYEVIPT